MFIKKIYLDDDSSISLLPEFVETSFSEFIYASRTVSNILTVFFECTASSSAGFFQETSPRNLCSVTPFLKDAAFNPSLHVYFYFHFVLLVQRASFIENIFNISFFVKRKSYDDLQFRLPQIATPECFI